MKSSLPRFLCDPVLQEIEVEHGFGTRGAEPPAATARPQQVHGNVVARFDLGSGASPPEADAILCRVGGQSVAVVTADCIPILVASGDGRCVAAVHAGWRGLARGVIREAVGALTDWGFGDLRAAIGPHARACCYEVDAPVLDALGECFGSVLDQAVRPTRPGHVLLDLQSLALEALTQSGIHSAHRGTVAASCTVCHPESFDSFRRDGAQAGRMVHWVRPRRDA
ncbi:MAG: polyphenol oxidase family protein [Myxococcota bacterium]|nr:polyphenol oxidase family protein [Myxococcota bacterium]